MFRELSGIERIILVLEPTDMRLGAVGLARTVVVRCSMNPVTPGILWLFRGRNRRRVKGLVYEGNRYYVFTQELIKGCYPWPPACGQAMMEITLEDYQRFIDGYSIVSTLNPRSGGK